MAATSSSGSKGILESRSVRLWPDSDASSGEESALRKLLRRPSFTLPKLSSGQSQMIWLDIHIVDLGNSMYWSNSRFGFFGLSRLKTAVEIISEFSHIRKHKHFTFQNSKPASSQKQPDTYVAILGCSTGSLHLVPTQRLYTEDSAQTAAIRAAIEAQSFVPQSDVFAGVVAAMEAVDALRRSFEPNHVIIQSVLHLYTDQQLAEVPAEYQERLKDVGLGASLSLFFYAFGGLTYYDLKEVLEHCKGELLCVDYSKPLSKIIQQRNQLIAELHRPFQSGAAGSAETHTLPNIHFLEEEAWHEELNVALTKLDPLFRFEKVLLTKGIFRVPGRADDVNELCHQITNIKDPLRIEVLLEDPQVIYTLADTFKRSLRHSKLELLPSSSLPNILRAAEQPDPVLRKFAVAKILSVLTPTLQEVLFRFFRILNRVSSYSEFNMMDAENLCIVFIPLLTSSKVRLSLKNLILSLIADPCYFFPEAASLTQTREAIASST